MRDERESHCAPTDIDVRVVVGAFSEISHPAHAVDGVEEGGEGDRPAQGLVATFPAVQSRRGGVDFVIA